MVQSEGARNLVCHYMMVPSGCLMLTHLVDKHSKLPILKFGIQTVLGLDNLFWPFLLNKSYQYLFY